MMPRIHEAGWPFIGLFFVISLGLFLVSAPLGWIGLVLTAWCVYFFRDPPRFSPVREGLILAPADGRVQWVGPAKPPEEMGLGDEPLMRVSIFLNVFDVHVNRIPVDGTISRTEYHPGKFLNASLDKASEVNERQAAVIDLADGRKIGVVQIAGLVARRIICNLDVGQSVRAGERFGLIRFGSRTDLFLPDGIAPLVAVGQRTVGGETVMADLTSTEAERPVEER